MKSGPVVMSTRVEATADDLARVPGGLQGQAGRREGGPDVADGGYPGRALVAMPSWRASPTNMRRPWGSAMPCRTTSGSSSISPAGSRSARTRPTISGRSRWVSSRGQEAFAVEVRSEGDYGPKAEPAMASKRRDYFAAGTRVVWDVDLLDEVVRCFRAETPRKPLVFRRGELAHAEPAGPEAGRCRSTTSCRRPDADHPRTRSATSRNARAGRRGRDRSRCIRPRAARPRGSRRRGRRSSSGRPCPPPRRRRGCRRRRSPRPSPPRRAWPSRRGRCRGRAS